VRYFDVKWQSENPKAKPAAVNAVSMRTFRMPEEMTRADVCERLTQLYAVSFTAEQQEVVRDDEDGDEDDLYDEEDETGPPTKKRKTDTGSDETGSLKHDITYAVSIHVRLRTAVHR
jgi:hypothetical protein